MSTNWKSARGRVRRVAGVGAGGAGEWTRCPGGGVVSTGWGGPVVGGGGGGGAVGWGRGRGGVVVSRVWGGPVVGRDRQPGACLVRLHCWHRPWPLAALVGPPAVWGTMWSLWRMGASHQGVRQVRSRTLRRSARAGGK